MAAPPSGKASPPQPPRNEEYRPLSARRRWLIAGLAVATSVTVILSLLERPGAVFPAQSAQAPQAPQAPQTAQTVECAAGQTERCAGGRTEVLAQPASAAPLAAPVSAAARP